MRMMQPNLYRRFLYLSIAALTFASVTHVVSISVMAANLASTATEISSNAAPSVVALTHANSMLGVVENIAEVRGTGESDVENEALDRALQEVNSSVESYLALPTATGESELAPGLKSAVSDLDAVVDEIRGLPEGQAMSPDLHKKLRHATTILSYRLDQAGRFNAETLRAHVARLDHVRSATLPVTFVIDGIGFVAATSSILIALALVRRARDSEALARKELEQRANELDAFSTYVAHDLLSPLMATHLALAMAKEKIAPEEEGTHRSLRRAQNSLVQVRTLVDGLLEYARAGAMPSTGATTQLGDAMGQVSDIFVPLAAGANIELVIEPMRDIVVAAAPAVVSSMISNLIQNAIKAVETRESKRVIVREGPSDDAKSIRIEVEDTGGGIPSELQPILFQPKARARGQTRFAAGLGLGLAAVRRFAESHGGTVGFQSSAGGGSTVWFTLPRACQSAA